MKNPNPLKIDTVLPLKVWMQDKPWNHFWVRWFLAYALLPLIMASFISDHGADLGFAAWFFGLYFAVLWLMVLYASMNPGKADVRLLAQIAAFTAFAGVVIVLMVQRLPPFNILYLGTRVQGELGLISRLLGFVLGVGVLEEGTKALPIYLFVYRRNSNFSPLMYSFIGAVSGLAFGVSEAVSYSYQYANHLVHGDIDIGSYVIVQLLRFISLPLLHACWSAIVGYFIGLAHLHRGPSRSLFLFGIGIAAALHGLYDTFGGGWGAVVMAGISLLAFVSYVRTSSLISKQLQAQYTATTVQPPHP